MNQSQSIVNGTKVQVIRINDKSELRQILHDCTVGMKGEIIGNEDDMYIVKLDDTHIILFHEDELVEIIPSLLSSVKVEDLLEELDVRGFSVSIFPKE